MASKGGILSGVNGFHREFDCGYGPRTGNAGVLDPVDALRKQPYGGRMVTCNIAHLPSARDINAAARQDLRREKEREKAHRQSETQMDAVGRINAECVDKIASAISSFDEANSGPNSEGTSILMPQNEETESADNKDDLFDPTGKHFAIAKQDATTAVDAFVRRNAGSRIISIAGFRSLVEEQHVRLFYTCVCLLV